MGNEQQREFWDDRAATWDEQAEWMHAAIVMVSVHNGEMDRVRGALAGCDAYLAKPLDPAELERLLLRQGLSPPNKTRTKYKRAAAAP